MSTDPSNHPAVRAFQAKISPYCPYWSDDAKAAVALARTRDQVAMAYDQMPRHASLDADIHRFMYGRDQMPATTPSAAMPPSRYIQTDQRMHTGSPQHFAQRNHGSDQNERVVAIYQAITELNPDEQAELFALINGNGEQPGEAEDQNGYSPMQFGGSAGTSPADLIRPGSSYGSFSEEDPVRGPSGTSDQDPAPIRHLPAGMVARELSRRGNGASDSRPRDSRVALDARIGQRHRNTAEFETRWGALTRHIDVMR